MDGNHSNEDARLQGPNQEDLIVGTDPFAILNDWMQLAKKHEINDPNAIALATTDEDGLPNVRMVLLKSFDPDGFVFFTNSGSQKGSEIATNAKAAAVLHWKSLERQIRFRGTVVPVSENEADTYFASRSRGSQIGAWCSLQSRPLPDRRTLLDAVAEQTARFDGQSIPRPEHWRGYRIVPSYLEFWMSKEFRLHDRVIFSRLSTSETWDATRYYP